MPRSDKTFVYTVLRITQQYDNIVVLRVIILFTRFYSRLERKR